MRGCVEMYIISSCSDKRDCLRSLDKASGIIEKMEKILEEKNFSEKRASIFSGPIRSHQKFKIAVSSCPNGCTRPYIQDFSLIAYREPIIDQEKCISCGACVSLCREEALSLSADGLKLDLERCLGCGDCYRACKFGAIDLGELKWRVLRGGKMGRHPKLARNLGLMNEQELLEVFSETLDIILENDDDKIRIADLFID